MAEKEGASFLRPLPCSRVVPVAEIRIADLARDSPSILATSIVVYMIPPYLQSAMTDSMRLAICIIRTAIIIFSNLSISHLLW